MPARAPSMYRAACSSSCGWLTLCGLLATARTCSSSRVANCTLSGMSGGSGPAWERPGTAVIQSTPATGRLVRRASAPRVHCMAASRVLSPCTGRSPPRRPSQRRTGVRCANPDRARMLGQNLVQLPIHHRALIHVAPDQLDPKVGEPCLHLLAREPGRAHPRTGLAVPLALGLHAPEQPAGAVHRRVERGL